MLLALLARLSEVKIQMAVGNKGLMPAGHINVPELFQPLPYSNAQELINNGAMYAQRGLVPQE